MPPEVWRERYDEINAFEHVLARNGTLILKFFLNLSKKEQKARLRERLRDPDKRWKANPGDWRERRLWRDYRRAFDGDGAHVRSRTIATPCPPPMHIVTSAVAFPLRSSSSRAVPMSIAPVAPSG